MEYPPPMRRIWANVNQTKIKLGKDRSSEALRAAAAFCPAPNLTWRKVDKINLSKYRSSEGRVCVRKKGSARGKKHGSFTLAPLWQRHGLGCIGSPRFLSSRLKWVFKNYWNNSEGRFLGGVLKWVLKISISSERARFLGSRMSSKTSPRFLGGKSELQENIKIKPS